MADVLNVRSGVTEALMKGTVFLISRIVLHVPRGAYAHQHTASQRVIVSDRTIESPKKHNLLDFCLHSEVDDEVRVPVALTRRERATFRAEERTFRSSEYAVRSSPSRVIFMNTRQVDALPIG